MLLVKLVARLGRARVGRPAPHGRRGRSSSAAHPLANKLSRSLLGEASVGMAVLLAAAVLVDSKPPPQPAPAARRKPLRSPDSRRTPSPEVQAFSACTSRATSSRRATRCARSTSCRSTTRSSATSTRSAATCATRARARELCDGADVVDPRGRGAADPRLAPRDHVRERRRDGDAARRRARRRRAAASSTSRRPPSTACRRCIRSPRTSPLVGVGAVRRVEDRVRAARARRRRSRPSIIRPKTFLGPERLGVFEILFDWIRDGRRIYVLGDGDEPLPAARRRGSRRRDRARVRRPTSPARSSTSARRSSAPCAATSRR